MLRVELPRQRVQVCRLQNFTQVDHGLDRLALAVVVEPVFAFDLVVGLEPVAQQRFGRIGRAGVTVAAPGVDRLADRRHQRGLGLPLPHRYLVGLH